MAKSSLYPSNIIKAKCQDCHLKSKRFKFQSLHGPFESPGKRKHYETCYAYITHLSTKLNPKMYNNNYHITYRHAMAGTQQLQKAKYKLSIFASWFNKSHFAPWMCIDGLTNILMSIKLPYQTSNILKYVESTALGK